MPVPRLLGVMPGDNGGWSIKMEYVSGRTLEEMMNEHPEKTDEYLEMLVDIQLETGAYRVPNLRNTRQKMADAIQTLKEIDASTRYELMQRIHGMAQHSKLCHGDLVPSNIVIREDGSYCILDWAHASAGNAGADAAITYLRFSWRIRSLRTSICACSAPRPTWPSSTSRPGCRWWPRSS